MLLSPSITKSVKRGELWQTVHIYIYIYKREQSESNMMPRAIKMSQLTVINCDKVHTDTLTHMKSKACAAHTHSQDATSTTRR